MQRPWTTYTALRLQPHLSSGRQTITGVKSTHNLAGGNAGSAIKGKGLYTLVVAGPRQCVPAGVSEYVQDPLQCKRDRRHSFSQLLGVLAADSSQLSPPTVSLS